MKNPAFKTPIVFGLMFIVVAAGIVFYDSSDRSLAAAIEKGLRYYTPQNLATVRVDDAFLLRLIEQSHVTREPFLLPLETIRTYTDDPFKRLIDPERPIRDIVFYRRAYPYAILPVIDNNSYLINAPYDAYLRDPYDDILAKALYCDLDDYDAADFAILKSIRSEAGDYADTHYLWGLLILRENECFDAESIAAEIESVVPSIVRAAETDETFSDLYAERIVLLYWAGYGNRVKQAWIKKVQDSLTNDPGWREYDHEASNAHTTGLALLSLIYFEAGKKEQRFYVRTPSAQPLPLDMIFSGGNIFRPTTDKKTTRFLEEE